MQVRPDQACRPHNFDLLIRHVRVSVDRYRRRHEKLVRDALSPRRQNQELWLVR